jgi:hypothetical protein
MPLTLFSVPTRQLLKEAVFQRDRFSGITVDKRRLFRQGQEWI